MIPRLRSLVIVYSLLLAVGHWSLEAGVFRAAPDDSAVRGEYIVVLHDHAAKLSLGTNRKDLPAVEEVARRLSDQYGFAVLRVWDRALRGFLMEGTEEVAKELAANRLVVSVEQNTFTTSGIDESTPVGQCYGQDAFPFGSIFYRTPPAASPQTITCTQPSPLLDPGGPGQAPLCIDNWGLDRIDQHASLRDGFYYFNRTGSIPGQVNVRIFLIDSGINAAHRDFLNSQGTATRALAVDFTGRSADPDCVPPNQDVKGHGTHTAGIAGGRIFGVAKNATLTMLDIEENCYSHIGRTDYSNRFYLIDALNYVAGQRPGVLSWSGGNSKYFNLLFSDVQAAVQGVVNSGVMVVQSAGNQSSPYPQTGYSPASYPTGVYDACEWSYGYLPGVLTVGGADQNNNRWTSYWSGDSPVGCTLPPGFDGLDKVSCGSNVGYCIDVWAPAANILSASRFDAYGYCRLSGTSMAAPHAAGVAALYLEAHPLALPAEVEAAIVAGATTGLLNTNPTTPNHIGSGSPNRLLYSFVP